ncbi:MAG: transposase [Deltaproteobacteria bacterium]|nr:transposase [Deltaproteobacteria bacterium]
MPDYRRSRDGRVYFFTVVTYMRQPVLCLDDSISALAETTLEVQQDRPFEIKAWVILPDHLHAIWELPEGDADYSARWSLIKKGFTKRFKGRQETAALSRSRIKRREAGVWQRRFWEHQVRDEPDFRSHVEYIHYNPVKHGLVRSPGEWKHSSFRRFVDEGLYLADWGGGVVGFEGIGAE